MIGIASCFLTGSSKPSNVNFHPGYALRVAGILIFHISGVFHLFLSRNKILKDRKKVDMKAEKFDLTEKNSLEVKILKDISSENELEGGTKIQ